MELYLSFVALSIILSFISFLVRLALFSYKDLSFVVVLFLAFLPLLNIILPIIFLGLIIADISARFSGVSREDFIKQINNPIQDY